MLNYFLKRLLLVIPTLFGILLINFMIVQCAPGGPIEQIIAKTKGIGMDVTDRLSGSSGFQESYSIELDSAAAHISSKYAGARGLDPKFIQELEIQFGFDKPLWKRFVIMVWNYLHFDFGTSYFKDEKVIDLLARKLPVSLSLGLWSTLIIYLVSIPLGIRKAVKDGSAFDVWSSTIIIVAYSVPGFLFGMALIIFFAGGSFWDLFPLRGLTSDHWEALSFFGKIKDYFWHITLPVLALVMGGFASLTMLTKNCFMDEIHKQYVLTARAKGLSERRVLYGHIFRNAMILVVSGFPAALTHILFTSALVIEVLFSLDGLGLLGFEALMGRDYPVTFGTLYIFTLLGLILNIIGDALYMMMDPRIDFNKRPT